MAARPVSLAERLALTYERSMPLADRAQPITEDFHRLFYDTERFASVTWRGHECWKMPTDLIVYAELLHHIQPAVVIECGRYQGGSALFFAEQTSGVVLSIDVTPPEASAHPLPEHERIVWLTGSSTSWEVVASVAETVETLGGPVFVVLDSDHTAPHVLNELATYGPMVTPGSYVVVEDTNLNGHPVIPAWGPGPWEAVEEWLPKHPEFVRDEHCERFLLTAAPGGWLRRKW